MKIRFITLDGMEEVRDCPDIEGPVTVVMRPCWKGCPEVVDGVRVDPPRMHVGRKYENRFGSQDEIPTVHEVEEK